ncbi:glycoside hydrolase/phage tail family protein [Pararhizobium sp. BT-229]|uniref:baseplate multidomain protein megatron n=1 Tax=Pararhizobium sp. BT-229 TaxID=2986923 RepID=UPI0021F6F755|nr:glycoside hydrolase/phage tail family protein [Pararhizobium sp. BT-229]MCV9963468.1 glycoside hydrolase/phage tail family protein [Pararhizobium sp. BT-229]
MATILLQAAGAALGSVFGPVGAVLGRAAGALAGSVIDRSIINGMTTVSGARLGDARIPGAEEGTAITRAYGTVRIGGTLIWATRFEEEVRVERQGGKASGPRVETFRYYANFALGICEGEIACIRRVWADGREIDLSDIEMRLYRGTGDQLPDPLIEAKQGAGKVPAYRGLTYAVFERFPLDGYGNRIPVIQFEVLRPVGRLEKAIRAVTIIPGSTEHGYDPRLVKEKTGAGASRLINRNVFHAGSDWMASIDELQALCPNLERVALVVSWFGTDLRAGHCRIVPGVETAVRDDESRPWSVSGVSRGEAAVVSRNGGGPAYGGTPSDTSVVAAIADLKVRGLKVYLYPFVMMDIAAGNILPNPYGGTGQPAYPWRGRITSDPAPGLPDSADRTAAARVQVDAFCGEAGAEDFSVSSTVVTSAAGDEGYRRLVLHYALLAEAAGGVDGFIIGSELRGLTQLRDGAGAFPFVEQLIALAGDVRAVLGSGAKLTYGADWSEYFGYHPADGSGEVHYNLDPLWASEHIDAIGIDNYMPLSDWRDGDLSKGNPDGFRLAEDADAMRAMIASGEGYDWYYAGDADRRDRVRTAITDGLAGKGWVYRYKDIVNWWGRAHHNRIGGAEEATPTAWVPGSKPIWFTELGCPAIDKGANQPNVFSDPKSSETAVPYFSNGARCDAMQRRFLDAQHEFWQGTDAPACVDPDHVFVWTWDARPVPAFPENMQLWSDGSNWQTGHWLNGRLGASTAADVIAAVLADHGFEDGDTRLVSGDLCGYVQSEQASARDVLEPLMAALQIDAVEEGGTLRFRSRMKQASPARMMPVLADIDGQPLFEDMRGHDSDFGSEAILDHLDPANAYERTTARSRRVTPANDRVLRLAVPGAMHDGAAASAVEDALRDHQVSRRSVRFSLSPAAIEVEPGDVFAFADGPAGNFIVGRIEDGAVRSIEARAFVPSSGGAPSPQSRSVDPPRTPSDGFSPIVHLMDLPHYQAGEAATFARGAVFARPWRTALLSSSATMEGYQARVRLEQPAQTGALVAALGAGVTGRFDAAQSMTLDLHFGGLSSAGRLAVLNGQNRIAVRAENGVWEIIGFRIAEEIAAGRWRLSKLLRGLHGTTDAMLAGAASGSACVALNAAVKPLGLSADEAGREINWIVEAGGQVAGAVAPFSFFGGLRAEMPIAPVHLRARRMEGGGIRIGWIRCARRDSDHWLDGDIALDESLERYRLDILDGLTVRRTVDVSQPGFDYAPDLEITDFGSPQTALSIRVRQRGQKVAFGVPAEAVLAL